MDKNVELENKFDKMLVDLNIKKLSFKKRIFNPNVVQTSDMLVLIKKITALEKSKESLENDKSGLLSKVDSLTTEKNNLKNIVSGLESKINSLNLEQTKIVDSLAEANKLKDYYHNKFETCNAEKVADSLEYDGNIATIKNNHSAEIKDISKKSANTILNNDSKKQKEIDKLNERIEELTLLLNKQNVTVNEPSDTTTGPCAAPVKNKTLKIKKKQEKVIDTNKKKNVSGQRSLSKEQVVEMRRLYDTKEITSFVVLAKKYELSESGVARICKRETYKKYL